MKGRLSWQLVCLLFVPLMSLQAQDANQQALLESTTPEERATVQTDLLQDHLQLNTTERDQLHPVNLKYAQQMESVIKGNDSKWKKYRTAKRLGKEKDEELKKLFSTAHYTAYLAYKDQLKKDGKAKLLALRNE